VFVSVDSELDLVIQSQMCTRQQNFTTHLLEDVHGFHMAFMGRFAIDNMDNELAWIEILRVESCLVLVLG